MATFRDDFTTYTVPSALAGVGPYQLNVDSVANVTDGSVPALGKNDVWLYRNNNNGRAFFEYTGQTQTANGMRSACRVWTGLANSTNRRFGVSVFDDDSAEVGLGLEAALLFPDTFVLGQRSSTQHELVELESTTVEWNLANFYEIELSWYAGVATATVRDADGALLATLSTVVEKPPGTFGGAFVRSENNLNQGVRFDWVEFEYNFTPALPAVADDRLRSSISETTGSLLEAVDVRAVDASVSEAYTFAQELPAAELATFREVLRERDSSTADFAYYPRPRQNLAMENQYEGVTILSRLSTYFPPRVFDSVDEAGLGIVTTGDATAQEVITYLLGIWATDTGWLTYETVPDLRLRLPALEPGDYTDPATGRVATNVLSFPQERTNRKSALDILKALLSPFPGTILRQNSAGNLEIVPTYGPDADATPVVTLENVDLYSVTIGKPDPFSVINRATASSSGYARVDETAIMEPAWFQVGGVVQFGNDQWYEPPGDRTNLQPFNDPDAVAKQELLAPTDRFERQRPFTWRVAGERLPAGAGISLLDGDGAPMVTLAWARYFADSLVDSGTNGLTVVTDVIPFSGESVLAFKFQAVVGGESVGVEVYARWNDAYGGVRFFFGDYNLETDRATGTNGVIVEFTLNDSSAGFDLTGTTTGSFGFIDNGDNLPATDGGNAIEESQTEYGVLEANINIEGYVLDGTTLTEIARAYVLQNITPKVVRDLDLSTIGSRVTFDTIGRLVELPNTEQGRVIGVTYADDFVARSWRKTAQVEVPNPLGPGAIDVTTNWLQNDDASFMENDDGSFSEAL